MMTIMMMTTTIPTGKAETDTQKRDAYAPPRHSAFVLVYGTVTSTSGFLVGLLLGWLFWGMH